jgi:hypothetical protein
MTENRGFVPTWRSYVVGKLNAPLFVESDASVDHANAFRVKHQYAIVRPTISKLIGRISFHLQIRAGWLFWSALTLFGCLAIFFPRGLGAGILSRFSLSVGEQYDDNIFFSKDRQLDFITLISPSLSLSYSPPGQTAPIFTADLTPLGQIFARHRNESNFGDNLTFNTAYTYYHSPRLTLYAGDTLTRLGQTRIMPWSESDFLPTEVRPVGLTHVNPFLQFQGESLSSGSAVNNYTFAAGEFKYGARIKFIGNYGFNYTRLLDQSGSDLSQVLGARAVYAWNEERSLHIGYAINFINSHDGHRNIVHNIDVGGDFLSSAKIQLDPTLTFSANTGIALNTGGDGPAITNSTNVTLTKVWETASLKAGVIRALTPSFGVAGISNTTNIFTEFRTRITERLSGFARVNYSLFDTKQVNFSTFEASSALAYRITRWLSAKFHYTHVWTDSGSGATSTDLLTSGKIDRNTVGLVFTATFDTWPNFDLAQTFALR